MKVSLGINLRPGPWGGGNQFGHVLTEYLRTRGVEVAFNLRTVDLDIILLFDPRPQSLSASFDHIDIVNYLQRKNWRTIVVHRVNECDERKGTTGVNQRLRRGNLCADHTVFVSTWLKDLHFNQGMHDRYYTVILNGSDTTIFQAEGYRRWNRKGPLKLVTHHWGGHWMKGFDIYERVDQLLARDHYRRKLFFTYIGNIPQGFRFQNATYAKPKHGHALASTIREHHVYLTASRNEPGSNHQNEGANCGLPLLYRESGCMPEYCEGFGVSFREENLEQKLEEMIETYDHWADRMKDYPHTAEHTCQEYYNLFEELLGRRDQILERRNLQRQSFPMWQRVSSWRGGKIFKWLKKGIFGACV